MQSFKFQLQPVLEFKEHVKDEIAGELARREAEVAQARAILDGLRREYANVRDELRHRQTSRLSVEDINMARLFLEAQTGKINAQSSVVLKIEEEVSECRERLVNARKETKILEKLRDKKRVEYQKQQLKAEQAFLDERAVQGFIRRETAHGVTSLQR